MRPAGQVSLVGAVTFSAQIRADAQFLIKMVLCLTGCAERTNRRNPVLTIIGLSPGTQVLARSISEVILLVTGVVTQTTAQTATPS